MIGDLEEMQDIYVEVWESVASAFDDLSEDFENINSMLDTNLSLLDTM
jgi:hypothetical protein